MKKNTAISKYDTFFYQNYRYAHGIRIAIAFVLTFIIIRLLSIPDSTWPLITLVVVMGPISYLGNVIIRALQRSMGTIIGAASGLIALYIELYSLPLMLCWCLVVMFFCGYLALGKRPYMGLLIGITLSVVASARPGDIHTALWRSADVIIGSLLAIFFSAIYPLRAYIHWRLLASQNLNNIYHLCHGGLSHNLIEQPNLEPQYLQVLKNSMKMRNMISPAAYECKIPKASFDEIQEQCRNIVATIELIHSAYWQNQASHLTIININTLNTLQSTAISLFREMSLFLQNGNGANVDTLQQQLQNEIILVSENIKHLEQQHSADINVIGYIWLNIELAKKITMYYHKIKKIVTE